MSYEICHYELIHQLTAQMNLESRELKFVLWIGLLSDRTIKTGFWKYEYLGENDNYSFLHSFSNKEPK